MCLRVSGYSELKCCGKELRLLIIVSSRRLFVPYKEGGKCTGIDELQENKSTDWRTCFPVFLMVQGQLNGKEWCVYSTE